MSIAMHLINDSLAGLGQRGANPARGECLFSKSYRSRSNQLDVIITEICEEITGPYNLDIDRKELYLLLDEAITNAMEHGNRWRAHKKVHINIYKEPGTITVTVADEGEGFRPGDFMSDLPHKDPCRRRCRGILLISKFCTPSWNGKGNEISLRIGCTAK